ncbi:MAG: hypothetical protein ACYC42_11145 [Lysobacter sp.]
MNADTTTRNRNRVLLIAIFAMFFGSMLVAGLLRFSGWRPAGTRNFGEMLDPPGDLRGVVPRRVDGSAYAWNPAARQWRIALAPPASCTTECEKLAHDLDTVWQLTGRDADRVDVLWICPGATCAPPAGAPRPATLQLLQGEARLRAALPRVDETTFNGRRGVPVYVIDPNGFVILRYPPGFDPGGLRADLAKLLKLK